MLHKSILLVLMALPLYANVISITLDEYQCPTGNTCPVAAQETISFSDVSGFVVPTTYGGASLSPDPLFGSGVGSAFAFLESPEQFVAGFEETYMQGVSQWDYSLTLSGSVLSSPFASIEDMLIWYEFSGTPFQWQVSDTWQSPGGASGGTSKSGHAVILDVGEFGALPQVQESLGPGYLPEPSTWIMLSFGLAGILGVKARKG